LEIDNQRFDFSLRSSVERIKSLNEMLEHLKRLSDSEKLRVVRCIVQDLGKDEKKPGALMLTWSELRKIAQNGWEIGSHTVNHKILTKICGEEAQKELSFSKEALETQLQRPVTLFAYPNGKRTDFDTGIKDIAREVGYRAAATALDGFNKAGLDPFEVRRHSVWEGHLPSFAVKLQLSYSRALKGRY
jgi:peptidoglycan/xylan/chitin deacetylase (PgdA/CDA1 family)